MDTWTLLGSAFLSCLVSGVVPLVNAELVVVVAAAMVPQAFVAPLVLVCAVGQMLSKTGIYACARWAPSLLSPEKASALDGLLERMGSRRHTQGAVVFASASLGLPPLYLVTVASGLLRVNTALFVGSGLVGRTVRFGLLALGSVSGAELLGFLPGGGH